MSMQSPQPQRPVMAHPPIAQHPLLSSDATLTSAQPSGALPPHHYPHSEQSYASPSHGAYSQQSSLQNVFESTADYMHQHAQAMATVETKPAVYLPPSTAYTPSVSAPPIYHPPSGDYTSVPIAALTSSSSSPSKKIVRVGEAPKYPYLNPALPTATSSPSHAGHEEINVTFSPVQSDVWQWTMKQSQQAYQSVSDAFDYMSQTQKMRRNLEFGMPAATSSLSSAASALTSWRGASQTTLGEVETSKNDGFISKWLGRGNNRPSSGNAV